MIHDGLKDGTEWTELIADVVSELGEEVYSV